MNTRRILTALVLFTGFATSLHAENWPCWRGPRGDGTSLETGVPTEWSGTENVVWKVALPGGGHSSPAIWGDQIFVVSCVEDTGDRLLLCLDRRTGKLLWKQTVFTSPLETKHTLNSYASSTPATDGKTIFVSFLDAETTEPAPPPADDQPKKKKVATKGRMVVAAYDLSGRQKWVVRPGIFSSVHGYCSSPVLFEDKVIINGDHDGEAYIVALNQATGETTWKVARENKTRSYCTPIIRKYAGRTQMILSGSKSVASYDPHDGSRIWLINGPTEQFVASMVDNGKLLFMTCGFPERHILAIKPDGQGNITDTHIVWRTTENASYVPSPIVVGDYFLVVSDQGIASCFEANTGNRLWRKRLGQGHSASLVTAGGLVYFTSDRGVTTIVKPGPEYVEVAKNNLGEDCFSSPAISRGQLFLRADKHLYCIGNASAQAAR
jgi:hypothetical protein